VAVGAQPWKEPASRALAERIIGELGLQPVEDYPTYDTQLLHGSTPYSRQRLSLGRQGGFRFVLIGYLFFMDSALYALLSPALRKKVGTNVILMPTQGRYVADW